MCCWRTGTAVAAFIQKNSTFTRNTRNAFCSLRSIVNRVVEPHPSYEWKLEWMRRRPCYDFQLALGVLCTWMRCYDQWTGWVVVGVLVRQIPGTFPEIPESNILKLFHFGYNSHTRLRTDIVIRYAINWARGGWADIRTVRDDKADWMTMD